MPPVQAVRRSASTMATSDTAFIDVGGLQIPAAALTWKFVRATGPGGQHVNKVSTAAECRLNLNRAGLAADMRARLERLAGSRLNAAGEVVLFADGERSQVRNRAAALARLAALLATARETPKPRIPTKPSPAQKAKRREEKKRRAAAKALRRSPESLED